MPRTRIVETQVFYAQARAICSEEQVAFAKACLASDPAIGAPIPELGAGIHEYVFRDLKLVVIYMFSYDFSQLILINAERDGIARTIGVTITRRARRLIGLLIGKGLWGG
jgi:hypothetical protein